ncbi:MAG: fumarate hydratase [Gammaproteobacteria bacterium]|nr:fumarate hydratase [Gammaproteobacteria bacterium]MYD77265.1 fumarate hydratase [Gammaproteobacteria bacterium]MYJ51587.1 fumarate hydratase [Gammaproteobacteria bacterium]
MLEKVEIDLPASSESLAKLTPGSVVYLNGVVYTAREGVYDRILNCGEALPVPLAEVTNANFHCSPAAALNDDGSYRIGAVTATASFRFSKYMGNWLDATGTKVVIGKGGMPAEDYRKILAPRGALYLTTVGYGTGALLGRGIRRVRSVHWLEELGIAQAMWLFEVRDFGPFLVDSDLAGNSLFAQQGELVNRNIEQVYEGLRKPALLRYGETDDRKDELI